MEKYENKVAPPFFAGISNPRKYEISNAPLVMTLHSWRQSVTLSRNDMACDVWYNGIMEN